MFPLIEKEALQGFFFCPPNPQALPAAIAALPRSIRRFSASLSDLLRSFIIFFLRMSKNIRTFAPQRLCK